MTIQTEIAVRHIASSHPYDSRGSGALLVRDNADEITEWLSAELTARVRPARVRIIETRHTRPSYAPEIAQAMLRQEQANAVVGARQRIVEGTVGMVRLALQRLDEEGSSTWTRSERRQWPPTCSWSCAGNKPRTRS